MGQSGEKIQFCIIWKFFLFHVILMVFFSKLFLMKNATKNNTSFEDNMSQNDLLSSHITVSSTLLCPALYCVQLITVSSTLLCPTTYCVHTYPKCLLFTFHISMFCGRIMLRLRSTSCSFLFLNRYNIVSVI